MRLFTNILIFITLYTWWGWLQHVLMACFGLWNISRSLKNACVIWHRVRQYSRVSQVAQCVKNLPAMQEMQENTGSMLGLGRSPGGGESHSSTLAWRIPWTEEPGGLQSMGSHRIGHDRSYRAHTCRKHSRGLAALPAWVPV